VFAAGARRVSQLGDGPIDAGKHANIAQPSPSCRNIIVSRDARNVLEPVQPIPAMYRSLCARKQIRPSRVVYRLVLFGLWLIQRYLRESGTLDNVRAMLIQDHNGTTSWRNSE